jgi:hypothetical protein
MEAGAEPRVLDVLGQVSRDSLALRSQILSSPGRSRRLMLASRFSGPGRRLRATSSSIVVGDGARYAPACTRLSRGGQLGNLFGASSRGIIASYCGSIPEGTSSVC